MIVPRRHRRWSLAWAAVDGMIVVLWYVSVALLAVATVLLCWFIGWKIIAVALVPEPTAPGAEVMACAVSDGRFSVQEVSCADPTAGWQILGTVPEVTLAGYEAGWRTVCAGL